MEVRPENNYVLCEIVPMKLPGDIIVNGGNKNYAHLVVIDVGPGKLIDSGQRVPPNLKKGDRVLIHEMANKSGRVQALETGLFDGREMLLVDAGDIIGVTSGDVTLPPPKIVRGRALQPIN